MSRLRTLPKRLAFRFRRSIGAFVCSKRRASLRSTCHFWIRRRLDSPSPPTYRSPLRNPRSKLAAFERTLRSCEEVMECYLMTGAFDYIVRVVASDMAGIERFVMTRLATIEG